ncbi:MAG TPA: ribosomal protein S18-alanine N-acetyltransferase [Conexivisphaerales archaeon]|nr:ribosomal protein S18-alanine N-acetyltransferase [Conexivisphaerales archaeon]
MRIRLCRPEDLAQVYEIEKESFPHPYDLDVFRAYLMRVECSGFDGFLVAEEGERVVGYAIFEYGRSGLIVSMAVAARMRRAGIGASLLREALGRLATKCNEVTLQVAVTNTPAQRLYEEFGFAKVKVLARYYPDGEDAYLMRRA